MQAKLGLIALGVIGTSMQFTGLRVQAQTALPPIVIETQGPAGAQGAPGGDVQDTDQQAAPDADPSTAIDGYVAESSATGTKTNTPLREIPQSVSVVTRDQIEDRGVETLGEAITYSAGVTVSPYGLDTRCDQFVIRGFEQNTTGVYRDGLRLPTFSFNCFRMEPYGVDHVDIMRGPTSTLFGLNNPGGLVNVVSKMPTEQAFGEVWASYGTHENKQTGFDVGGPLDSNGKVLYRITGVLRDSETQVDFVEDDRVYIAPALTFKPSDATTFTILSHYQKDKSGDTFQLLPLEGTLTGSPFGQLPRSRFLGEPDFSGRDSEEWSIGYMLDHKVQPGITFRQNLRYDHLDLEYNTLYGAGQLVGTPLLLRFAQQADQSLDLFQVDNQLQFDSRFERVENTLLIGADYSHFSGQSQLGFAAVGNSADPTLPVFNPFNPSYGQFFFINTQTFQPVETIPVFQDREQTQEQFGIYVQDQVKFDKHWVVTLNGRYDWVTSEFKDAATDLIPVARTQEKEDEAFTGRIAWLSVRQRPDTLCQLFDLVLSRRAAGHGGGWRAAGAGGERAI